MSPPLRNPARSRLHRAVASVGRGRGVGCATCIVLLLLAILPGCAFRSAPADDRALGLASATLPPEAWPPRETELLEDMVAITPKALTLTYPVSAVVDGRLTTVETRRKVEVVSTGAFGRGIVRRLRNAPGETTPDPAAPDAAEALQFVSFPPDPNAVRVASAARADDSMQSRYRRLLLRRLSIRGNRAGDTFYLMRDGTHMRLFEPASSGAPAGVVLHLSSLAGFEYEKPVIDRLCASGWMVLQIDASTVRRRENPVDADVTTDLRTPAQRLARLIDNRVAEIAYAAEAGLDYLQSTYPPLADAPVVVAGYSAGALVGPSVATLIHDRLDALVLVGGGANLLNISRRSSLTNGGITVNWSGGPVTDADWARLEAAYLDASRLDPYTTAPCLVDKPVLVLHGIFDDIVPADTGDLLQTRLGNPERLVYTLGHRGLFWRLPAQADVITNWITAHARRPEAGRRAQKQAAGVQ